MSYHRDMERSLKQRDYADVGERVAFRVGFHRGYTNMGKDGSTYASRFTNAYSAGYWEGTAKRKFGEGQQ